MLLLSLLLVSTAIFDVYGHGWMKDPPARGSLWKVIDDPLIAPYEDQIKSFSDHNGLRCGGLRTQRQNDGKCGVCGDAFSGPRDNEAGGKYALGIITRYYETGQTIPIEIFIDVPHGGYFSFRLCPWNNPQTPVTQDCLNRHLLRLENGSTHWFIPDGFGIHTIMVQLPANISCSQCVLQYQQRTGNARPGDNSLENDEYYGCSDIAIGVDPPSDLTTTTSTQPPTTTTRLPTTTTQSPTTTTQSPTTTTPSPTTTTQPPTTTTRPSTTIVTATRRPLPNRRPSCRRRHIGRARCFGCDHYYRCTEGQRTPVLVSCASGQACKPQTGRCVPRHEVRRC